MEQAFSYFSTNIKLKQTLIPRVEKGNSKKIVVQVKLYWKRPIILYILCRNFDNSEKSSKLKTFDFFIYNDPIQCYKFGMNVTYAFAVLFLLSVLTILLEDA